MSHDKGGLIRNWRHIDVNDNEVINRPNVNVLLAWTDIEKGDSLEKKPN